MNKSITEIYLAYNELKDKGANDIAQGLKDNKTITYNYHCK